jgi:hypothetical protein
MPDVFIDMVEVNKAADVLCAAFGEEHRDRIKRVLFLGVDALSREESYSAPDHDPA